MNKLSLTNQAQLNTTNMLETLVGALNIAPTKISGQYKIVVVSTNEGYKLFLDDYTGRRVAIDKTVSFLQQVANFLQVETELSDNSVLRYGGFQRNLQKTWHIPFYFNTEDKLLFPRYFVLSLVPNETMHHISYDIDNQVVGPESDLYEMKYPFKYGNIIKVIDLEEIGLHAIMDEINSEDYFRYPLYFNWEDNNLKLYGYGINEGYPVVHTIDLINYMSNQPYIDVLNNKILNTYKEKKLFFPRFLNIEFEFDYSNEYNHFNNFMGYLANRNEFGQGNKVTCSDQNLYIKIQDYDFKYQQVDYFNDYTLNKYLHLIADGTVNEIHERNPQYRFRTYRVQANDYFKIEVLNEQDEYEVGFEYLVKPEDIDEESLFKTWIKICYNCTKESGRNYVFNPKQISDSYVEITITNLFGDLTDEETRIELPSYYEILDRFDESDDNYHKFRGITQYDILLCGQPNLMENVKTILIDNKEYAIVEKFKFNDATILRLDKISGVDKVTRAYIFEDLYEEVIELKPINFLSYYSDLESKKQYDFEKYKQNLSEMFSQPNPDLGLSDEEEELRFNNFKDALSQFNTVYQEALYQYIGEENNELIDRSKIDLEYHNENIVMNMLFNSMGQTTYMTPNVINLDKQFWNQNGCVDQAKERNDYLRFNWFLINGICPDYLKGTDVENRYMNISEDGLTVRPKITSRLIRISDSLCETVFLGVKYQLPIQYENYQFAVYLNFNNQKDSDLHYTFEIYPNENLLLLSINKYLDFNDLLRGGDDRNKPLLDLSFFYNITNSSNKSSDYLFSFRTCGIILEPFYNHDNPGDFRPLFNNTPQNQWRLNYNGVEYICLQREITAAAQESNSFKLLFPSSGNAEFYVYSKIKYKDVEYQYISMTFQIIGIHEVQDDYLWCQDIRVKFFDTKTKFFRRVNPNADLSEEYRNPDIEEILMIDESNIISYEPINENEPWGANHQIATIIVDNKYEKFELLLPNKTLSFKEEYFEIHQTITENPDGSKNYFKTVFKFPEFALKGLDTDEKIIKRFDNGYFEKQYVPDDQFDKSTYSQMMTLFDRNQIWRVIQDMLDIDLKFKYMTADQIRMLFDDFTVQKLIDQTTHNSLQITNRTSAEWGNIQYIDEYIKLNVIDIDKNVVIWDILNQMKVNLINRFRTPYLPYLPLYKDFFEFQLEEFKKYGTLWNLYDKQFGGFNSDNSPISATGLWKEVNGNIISTLFCKIADYNLSIPFQKDVDYRDLLIQTIKYEECIVTNDNKTYIESLNKNSQKYIIESYADMLLKNFYYLDNVHNELGMRLKFTQDTKNKTLLHFEDKYKYGSTTINFRNLIIVLKRKK